MQIESRDGKLIKSLSMTIASDSSDPMMVVIPPIGGREIHIDYDREGKVLCVTWIIHLEVLKGF